MPVLPRLAEHFVEAVHAPDREHVRRVPAADEDDVLPRTHLAQVGRRPREEGEVRRLRLRPVGRVERDRVRGVLRAAPSARSTRVGRVQRTAHSRRARRRGPRRRSRRCVSRPPCGSIHDPWRLTSIDFDEPLRRRPRAARRQGDRARGDDPARDPRARRVHDHDRRLPRIHGRGRLPDGLDDEVAAHIGRLEERAGKRFGDPSDPLLVSVRSGAAISMPGMMDTILNLGLNDVAVEGLARTTGNPRFALDSYRRLIQMYGEVVDGIDGHRLRAGARRAEARSAASRRTPTSPPTTSRELVETFKQIYREETGEEFPQDAREQLRRAVSAVFDSWDTPRANVYRRAHDIPDDLGTAVNVVQMVFGNKGDDCGTGVCFTRDPSTGEQGIYGEFLVNAQGEDVVAGIRTPEPLEAMRARLPDAFDAAARDDAAARAALPRHAGHRVHRRGGAALPAPDARGEAHGGCGAQGGGRHGRRGPDLARGGRRAHRPGAARPAPAPDARPERDLRRRGDGSERKPGRGVREDRLRRGHRGRARRATSR